MEFMLVSTGMIVLVVVVLVLLGRAYPGSGADLVDWKPTRSYEDEARLEVDDVRQMMEAQNAMRRRRGAAEMTSTTWTAWSPRTRTSAPGRSPDLTGPEPEPELSDDGEGSRPA